MNYNPETPTAVFLGPSLDIDTARSILPANYYPPVRLGDIYRLLATGVRTIAVIDGLFHESTPVWQRELVAALEIGIQVVGGCSMGALRAAEVAPYGMVGVGTIFEWYRDGVIDGDDEVALLHMDTDFGYEPMSEPLVNVRFTLQRAVEAGLIDGDSRNRIVGEAKRLFFGERSWSSIFESKSFREMPDATQRSLEVFIVESGSNVKRDDALAVLNYCAANEPTPTRATQPHWSYWGQRRPFIQCALTTSGSLVSGEQIVMSPTADDEMSSERATNARKRFFLLAWLRANNIEPDAEFCRSFVNRWYEAACADDRERWLSSNGITQLELDAELTDQASIAWLERQEPATFGLEFNPHERCLDALVGAHPQGDALRDTLRREAAVGCYLSTWAHAHDVQLPAGQLEAFLKNWEQLQEISSRAAWLEEIGLDEKDYVHVWGERALGNWMLEQGPAYFGYPTWSAEAALLRQLQFEGQAAVIAEQLTTKTQALEESVSST